MSEAGFTQSSAEFDQAQDRLLNGIDQLIGGVGPVGVGTHNEGGEATDALLSAPHFPVNVFPSALKEFITEAAESLPVPVDLVAAPVLACLGGAIGAHRLIQPKQNWTTSSALYVACIADPGSLKSAALNIAAAPVFRQQDQYDVAYKEAQQRFEEDEALYRRALDAHRKNQADSIPLKPVKPVLQRTWTADVTTERLAGILQENARGVVVIRDELSAWIKSFNQYKGGKGADKQFYLSAWSGERIAVDRQGKDPLLVRHPYLSVVGCIPPDVLPDLDEDNREDGFLHRLLFVYPDPVPVRWNETVISDSAKKAFSDLLARLYALKPAADGNPLILNLTTSAKKLFIEWHDTHCAEQEDLNLPPLVRGAYAKLKGYAPRLALIHALASNPDAFQVEAESIGAAAELVEYFKIQVRRVAPLLAGDARTPEGRCKASLKRQFVNGRRLSKRQAQRGGTYDAATFNRVWDEWMENDVLSPERDDQGHLFYYMKTAKQENKQ